MLSCLSPTFTLAQRANRAAQAVVCSYTWFPEHKANMQEPGAKDLSWKRQVWNLSPDRGSCRIFFFFLPCRNSESKYLKKVQFSKNWIILFIIVFISWILAIAFWKELLWETKRFCPGEPLPSKSRPPPVTPRQQIHACHPMSWLSLTLCPEDPQC